ncbi:MAG: type VI secretion system ATPase TssH, partial [Dysgonamonadaceae bacterium]|nr:type VI secretion system ATPase TssH [Dysgonamonadaceae bacterium]
MNFNNFTVKAQSAVQKSIDLTRGKNQQAIEPAHLTKAILEEAESITNLLFQKMGVNSQQFAASIDKAIDSFPKVSGGEPFLSRETNAVLQKAIDVSSKMGDQYVSIEPIILALFLEKSDVSTLMKDAGITEKDLTAAIGELRKGNPVTSPSAEDTYQS